jgi:diacylglycerol kinase (ATP)
MVSRQTPARLLERQQKKHAKLLARVEATAARLERRKAKLHALEERLAELELRAARPRRHQTGRRSAASDREARLIFNPFAGRDPSNNGMRLAHVASALRVHGIEPEIGVKTSGAGARELAREARSDGIPLVIVAAGDGTIEEVASELIGSGITIGIVPLGTMNNLARSLGISLDIDEACAQIGMGARRHIDVGHVSSNGPAPAEHFLECAGMGLSAIGALAGEGLEKHRWHLLPRIVRQFLASKPSAVRVAIDDLVLEPHTRIVTVSNSPYSGSNLLLAPEAKMDDGLLDVIVYDRMGDPALMKHFIAAGHHDPPKLPTHRGRSIRITAEIPEPIHSDGDTVANRQVIQIGIMPQALTVIAGNGIGLTVPVEASPGVVEGKAPAPSANGAAEEPIRQEAPEARNS